jgi:hypothetical protein
MMLNPSPLNRADGNLSVLEWTNPNGGMTDYRRPRVRSWRTPDQSLRSLKRGECAGAAVRMRLA